MSTFPAESRPVIQELTRLVTQLLSGLNAIRKVNVDRRYLPPWMRVVAESVRKTWLEEMASAYAVYVYIDETTCVRIHANMIVCVSYVTLGGVYRMRNLGVVDVSSGNFLYQ